MQNTRLKIIILLYGLSNIHGFLHFKHDDCPFKRFEFFNKSTLQNLPKLWFEQPVDHFNSSDQRTWKQKYYKITDAWKPGGPILLYISGESALDLSMDNENIRNNTRKDYYGSNCSFIDQIVFETGAVYFFLEHRYYGESQPLDGKSTENLAFLSSRQALADIANVLTSLKKSSKFENSKVILVGCSYPGSLAAWMKLLYPSLVDAVLSSSGPVLAKKDFGEYFETVTDTFRIYGSQECVEKIADTFNTYEKLFQSPEGIEKLKKEQNICENSDMTVLENQQVFISCKMNPYAYISQYGTPYDVAEKCENPHKPKHDNQWCQTWNAELVCNQYDFNEYLSGMREMISWVYQTCTEFGYFQSTSSSKQMFGTGFPVEFYYKICRILFGEDFDEARVDRGVAETNRMYGGLSPKVKNVVFVHGNMDPWHRLGVVHDLSADAPAIYINGSSHCNEWNLCKNESKENETARKQILSLLKKWIAA